MKRFTTLLFSTAALLFFLLWGLPMLQKAAVLQVETAVLANGVFYESVSCGGTLAPKARQSLALGTPSTVLRVHVQEGDVVSKGDILLEFRPLSDGFSGLSALYSAELFAFLAEPAPSEGILEAAEHFAKTGELPDYFMDFYLPESVSASANGAMALFAPMDGTITKLRAKQGDVVTGAFASLTIATADELVAVLQVPERHAAKLAVNQTVNVYSALAGPAPLAGRVISIADHVKTVGGILTGGESVLECVVRLPGNSFLKAGFSVQAYVFVNIHRGILLPYEAVLQDGESEYVFILEDGKAVRRDFSSFFENDEGVLPASGFAQGDKVILHPPEGLTNGAIVNEKAGSP